MQALKYYLHDEQLDQARDYLNQLEDKLDEIDDIVHSGNTVMDAVVNSKLALAEQAQIATDVSVFVGQQPLISDIDLVVILGNVLDNAIEAAANAGGEKYIFIKISAYHKMTVVHIENSCGKVKWKKRMPVSDKGKGRGIGLLNVKQSIDKYDGDLQLKQDGNRFVADLFLNS